MLKTITALETGDKFLYTYKNREHIVHVVGKVWPDTFLNGKAHTYGVMCEVDGRTGYMTFGSETVVPLVFKKNPHR